MKGMVSNHTEEWHDVPGYEGYYQVSTLGRVKSVARRVMLGIAGLSQIRERILKAGKDSSGHLQVNLCKDGKQKMFCIHVLVLTAFVGPKPEGMEARHFPDMNKSNNRLENLSWDTHAENMKDTALYGNRKGTTPAPIVKKIRKMSATGMTGAEISRQLSVSEGTVSRILTGQRRRHI